MAEIKTKKTSASKSAETASTREALVKKVSAEQKAASKTKKTTTTQTATKEKKTDVVRTSSLEEKYLAKVQADKKPDTKAKTSPKATETKASKTTAKATDNNETKSEPKETKVVKATPKAEDGKKDVRVGSVVVDEDMAKAKAGMQQSKKDKQKNLAIIILSSLLVVVIVVSLIFVLGNLDKDEIGEMKVEGTGVSWILDGKSSNTFSISNGDVQPGCMINIDIALKKTTSDTINIRFELKSYKNGEFMGESMLRLLNPNSALKADEANGLYYLENWDVSSGSTIDLSDGFIVMTLDSGINNDNYRIIVTAVVY